MVSTGEIEGHALGQPRTPRQAEEARARARAGVGGYLDPGAEKPLPAAPAEERSGQARPPTVRHSRGPVAHLGRPLCFARSGAPRPTDMGSTGQAGFEASGDENRPASSGEGGSLGSRGSQSEALPRRSKQAGLDPQVQAGSIAHRVPSDHRPERDRATGTGRIPTRNERSGLHDRGPPTIPRRPR